MSNLKERLINSINRYEREVINPRIKDITISFILQIIYIIALIIFSFLIIMKPNISNVIGTLGLSGLGITANWKRLQESVFKFLKDRRVLLTSVTVLRGHLDLCDDNDESCLKEIENQIKEYYQRAAEA